MNKLPEITIVVAMAANRVIGANNALPWHLPEDLAHFKATTMDGCLIMGRKTFDSIGRPLPGRRTIVVTRNKDWAHSGCETAASVEAALDLAALDSRPVFVVGGAQIYEQTMGLAQRIVATEVALDVAGDAVFPVIDLAAWAGPETAWQISKTGMRFRVVNWVKKTVA